VIGKLRDGPRRCRRDSSYGPNAAGITFVATVHVEVAAVVAGAAVGGGRAALDARAARRGVPNPQ